MRIEPFAGVRYDPERVELSRVLAPQVADLDEESVAALYARDARNVIRLVFGAGEAGEDDPVENRSRQFFVADWLRAGILVRDEYPALYVLRETFLPEGARDPVTSTAFFASVRAERDQVRVLHAQDKRRGTERDTICALYDDPRGRVRRILRAETEELEPDARFSTATGQCELFVVDDETACARVRTTLDEQVLSLLHGAHAHEALPQGFPFVALLVARDDPRARPAPVHRWQRRSKFDRARFLEKVAGHFEAEPMRFEDDVEDALRVEDTAFVLMEHDGNTRFFRTPVQNGTEVKAGPLAVQQTLFETLKVFAGKSVSTTPRLDEARRRVGAKKPAVAVVFPPLADEAQGWLLEHVAPPQSVTFEPAPLNGVVFSA